MLYGLSLDLSQVICCHLRIFGLGERGWDIGASPQFENNALYVYNLVGSIPAYTIVINWIQLPLDSDLFVSLQVQYIIT